MQPLLLKILLPLLAIKPMSNKKTHQTVDKIAWDIKIKNIREIRRHSGNASEVIIKMEHWFKHPKFKRKPDKYCNRKRNYGIQECLNIFTPDNQHWCDP